MIITHKNLLEFINKDINTECHNIIFNILKNYNVSYSQNMNGVFINMENITPDIEKYIITYINNYYKIKAINNKLNLHNKRKKENNNKNIFIIQITNDELNIIKDFKDELFKSLYSRYHKNPLIKKRYNCKTYNNELFLNNLKKENVLI